MILSEAKSIGKFSKSTDSRWLKMFIANVKGESINGVNYNNKRRVLLWCGGTVTREVTINENSYGFQLFDRFINGKLKADDPKDLKIEDFIKQPNNNPPRFSFELEHGCTTLVRKQEVNYCCINHIVKSQYTLLAKGGGKKESAGKKEEMEAVATIRKFLADEMKKYNINSVKFKLPNGEIRDIIDARLTFGSEKSDFHLVSLPLDGVIESEDAIERGDAKCCCYFVSYKKDKAVDKRMDDFDPTTFQSYGGLTPHGKNFKVSESPITKLFETLLKKYFGKSVEDDDNEHGFEFSASLDLAHFDNGGKIQAKILALRGIYGKDYSIDKNKSGKNNVDIVIQGDLHFKLVGTNKGDGLPIYQMLGDSKVVLDDEGKVISTPKKYHTRGEIPTNTASPVLSARRTSERSNFGIKGLRVAIAPQAYRTHWKYKFVPKNPKRVTFNPNDWKMLKIQSADGSSYKEVAPKETLQEWVSPSDVDVFLEQLKWNYISNNL